MSYANVMSTVAVFVALGGTSYALTLPRNSVGPEQLRTNSVGSAEIRRQAVQSIEIKNRSIRLRDISERTRDSLRRSPGSPGAAFFQSVNSSGIRAIGNADAVSSSGANGALVTFNRTVASCVAVASITSLPGGPNPDPPGGGQVTAQPTADGRVLVRTYNSAGQPAPYPFNLIVAC